MWEGDKKEVIQAIIITELIKKKSQQKITSILRLEYQVDRFCDEKFMNFLSWKFTGKKTVLVL